MKTSEQVNELAAAAPLMVGRLWSPVPGASDYFVSDQGDVLSMVNRPRVLRPIMAGKYRAVQLRHSDGASRKKYVHRILLEAFFGKAEAGHEARHIDGDRFNNTIGNLAWGTRLENHDDKRQHGTTAKGERNPQAKLTTSDVAEMRRQYAAGGVTYRQLGDRFGVNTMTALRAVKGESWK